MDRRELFHRLLYLAGACFIPSINAVRPRFKYVDGPSIPILPFMKANIEEQRRKEIRNLRIRETHKLETIYQKAMQGFQISKDDIDETMRG